MSADMKSYVSELLEGYRARERKIAVLRYDLEHPSEVGVTEQIEAMNYGSGEGVGHSKGHISNKTLYIALNYEEQAKQLNAESAKEITDEAPGRGCAHGLHGRGIYEKSGRTTRPDCSHHRTDQKGCC